MKRAREETEEGGPSQGEQPAVAEAQPPTEPAQQGGEDDDDRPLLQNYKMSRAVRKGAECPYLDTISRQNLDFDFEKCCSVCLSRVNVYACLVCGKYFQGRGPATQAYTHSLEAGHHLFMSTESGRVYCLPDMYEVQDRSLADIQFVLNPTYTAEEVARLDSTAKWSRALDGSEYMPGLVGLNNLKHSDYANVVVQALLRVHPVRDFFLTPANYAGAASPLVSRFGELVRKVWNPRAFKGQVSPHEFMQAVMAESGKRFTADRQEDPVEFYAWLVNALHLGLTGGRRRRRSVVTDCLQGELRVVTAAGTGRAKDSGKDLVESVPFFFLGLDLPPAPLFKDALEKIIIPQVPIFDILRKFDGAGECTDHKAGRRTLALSRLPRFLALHVRRFLRNQFFVEKNPTIVNFPVKALDLAAAGIPLPKDASGRPVPSRYDLVANIVHEGKTAKEGSYRMHLHRRAEEGWYEVQDLRVGEVLPQMVALSEAYMQVYELKAPGAAAGAGGAAGAAAGGAEPMQA